MAALTIVGCGVQGTGMTQKLLELDHRVVVHDKLEAQTLKAAEMGAEIALDPVRAVGDTEVVCLILPAGSSPLNFLSEPSIAEAMAGKFVLQMGNTSLGDTICSTRSSNELGSTRPWVAKGVRFGAGCPVDKNSSSKRFAR